MHGLVAGWSYGGGLSDARARSASELPAQTYRVTRADLVRYAGASGDFNPIHWSDRIAAGGRPARRDRPRHVHDGAGRPGGHRLGRRPGRGGRVRRAVHPPGGGAGRRRGRRGRRRPGSVKRSTETALAQIDLTVTCGGEKVLGAGHGPGPCAADRRARAGRGRVGRIGTAYPYTGRPWGESPLSRCALVTALAGMGRLGPRRGVAQLAAQRSPKPQVAGSSPVAPAPSRPARCRREPTSAERSDERGTAAATSITRTRAAKWPKRTAADDRATMPTTTSTTSDDARRRRRRRARRRRRRRRRGRRRRRRRRRAAAADGRPRPRSRAESDAARPTKTGRAAGPDLRRHRPTSSARSSPSCEGHLADPQGAADLHRRRGRVRRDHDDDRRRCSTSASPRRCSGSSAHD